MSRHAYPLRTLLPDYGRTALGLLLSAGPLFLAGPSPLMVYILSSLAVIFLLYGLRTVLRQARHCVVDDSGITVMGPLGGSLSWENLRRVRLHFYSTRRDRGRGWMQLTVADERRSFSFDSGLEGFAELARRAVRAAEVRRLEVSEATRVNLASLGTGSGHGDTA